MLLMPQHHPHRLLIITVRNGTGIEMVHHPLLPGVYQLPKIFIRPVLLVELSPDSEEQLNRQTSTSSTLWPVFELVSM